MMPERAEFSVCRNVGQRADPRDFVADVHAESSFAVFIDDKFRTYFKRFPVP